MSKKIISILAVALVFFSFSNSAYLDDQKVLSFTNVSISPVSNFDPSSSGLNQRLQIIYETNETADLVSAKIVNSNNIEVRTLTASNGSPLPSFDGKYAGKILEAGNYKVLLTATKNGFISASSTKDFNVSYNSNEKANFNYFNLSNNSFNPDFEDISINFSNSRSAEITVKIYDSNNFIVKGFSGYNDDSYSSSQDHKIVWNGKNDSGYNVSKGNYYVKIVLRNSYGVSVEEKAIYINDDYNFPSSNDHINNISLRPSTFYPAKDDEIRIKFDIKRDLEKLEIFAVKGNDEIRIFREYDLYKENNFEFVWDGLDENYNYIEEGRYRIEFRSSTNSNSLVCGRTIEFKYESVRVSDIYLSKYSIDNDLGEYSYVLFKTDSDGFVDVEILLDGRSDEIIEEELEVEKNKWYGVVFDGSSYKYGENISISVKAYNKYNSSVFSSRQLKINLAEERSTSNRANISLDNVSPVISDGSQKLNLSYYLDENADVVITLHNGSNASGSLVGEILNIKNQKRGSHSVSFDAKDSSGNKLSNGVYSYKIVSKLTNQETETGIFVIGSVGDISSSSNEGSSSSKVMKNVIINGILYNGNNQNFDSCAGFIDLPNNFKYCDAIIWAKEKGIINGYNDNSFRPYNSITRAEILKVVIEANNIKTDDNAYGAFGFVDVEEFAWYSKYLKAGILNNIFSGDFGKNTARLGDFVNRAETLKLLFEAKNVNGFYNLSSCGNYIFEDVKSNEWFSNYACEAKRLNLFESNFNYFNPSFLSSRGEVVQALYILR